jgi:RHS repeat-associated protein
MNVTALVNQSDASVAERYVYDPYGQPTIYDSTWTNTRTFTGVGSKLNEILYCGYRYDTETGLYHVRNRYYHPTVGRWMTRDPIEEGVNLYQYSDSDPAGYLDSWGLAAESSTMADDSAPGMQRPMGNFSCAGCHGSDDIVGVNEDPTGPWNQDTWVPPSLRPTPSYLPQVKQPEQPTAQPAGVQLTDFMKFTEPLEGRRQHVYPDTKGKLTVGVGFNLNRVGAKADFAQLLPGVSYADVKAGKVVLTNAQIDILFSHDMKIAADDAKVWIPGLGDHPEIVQEIVVDMRFAMGATTVRGYEKFQAALTKKDYFKAAAEIKDSAWYNDKTSGDRPKTLYKKMCEAAESQGKEKTQ